MQNNFPFESFIRDFMGVTQEHTIKKEPPKTTDKPNIDMFMLQMMNAYAGFTDLSGMCWAKTFKDNKSGKKYTITVEMHEAECD